MGSETLIYVIPLKLLDFQLIGVRTTLNDGKTGFLTFPSTQSFPIILWIHRINRGQDNVESMGSVLLILFSRLSNVN